MAESNKLYIANGGNGECNVYDGSTYAFLKRLDLGGDADNMHYAAAARQLVVSAGNGLSSTAQGARTSLWVPELDRLFVAVPHNGSQRAEIRIYEPAPP